ncbi:MAG: hypothetical protein H7239_04450 [Flavobacterium sp.]|nr:hypothetical protein [Flavobacterium sp.]
MNQILEIIYQHLCEQESKRMITIERTEPMIISLCDFDYEEFRKDVKERLKIKLKTGLCSEFLIDQFTIHKANQGEKYGDKTEYYNVSEILQLIEQIEDNKVVGTPFKKEPLSGYLHIHHNACTGFGSSLVRNIKEYWFKNNGKIHPHRIEEFEKILNQHINNQLSTIAIIMHDKAVFNRNLRGEWLMYKIVDNKKYYLCLAAHKEGIDRRESDKNIFFNKISKSLMEFPELKFQSVSKMNGER